MTGVMRRGDRRKEIFRDEVDRESAEVRAERIIAEELRRQGWRGADLAPRRG